MDDVSNVAVVGSAAAFASSLFIFYLCEQLRLLYQYTKYLSGSVKIRFDRGQDFRRRYHERYDQCVDPPGRVFTIVLPLLILVTGLVIWIRRRNR